jgi:hypothetical protein
VLFPIRESERKGMRKRKKGREGERKRKGKRKGKGMRKQKKEKEKEKEKRETKNEGESTRQTNKEESEDAPPGLRVAEAAAVVLLYLEVVDGGVDEPLAVEPVRPLRGGEVRES